MADERATLRMFPGGLGDGGPTDDGLQWDLIIDGVPGVQRGDTLGITGVEARQPLLDGLACRHINGLSREPM